MQGFILCDQEATHLERFYQSNNDAYRNWRETEKQGKRSERKHVGHLPIAGRHSVCQTRYT